MYRQKKALSLIAILLLSISIEAKINIPASAEKQKLCKEIYQKMTDEHFFSDKDLSFINSEIFDALLDKLDSQKIYFTENEISSYKRKFSKFDNSIRYQKKYFKPSLCSIDMKSNFAFINLYFNRLIEASNYQLGEVAKQDFDFTKDEFIIIDDNQKEFARNTLLEYVRFSNLMKIKEDNIPHIMKLLWDNILSEHPKTNKIFIKGGNFNINKSSTYIKIFKILNEFNFDSVGIDILGEAYEEVIKDIMIGKVLGQFFTPPKIKNFIINKIKPKLFEDGSIETIFDPALGTGGFLLSALKYLKNESINKKINIDLNFLSNFGLGGRELEPDTFQLAMLNMLISTGNIFGTLEKGDSIRSPI